MAEKPPFDPATAVRDWFTQWEKVAREQGGQILADPEVQKATAAAGAAASETEAHMRDAAGGWLKAMNLPSRQEVAELADMLRQVDARLARIEAALGTATAAAPPPKRSRKPKA